MFTKVPTTYLPKGRHTLRVLLLLSCLSVVAQTAKPQTDPTPTLDLQDIERRLADMDSDKRFYGAAILQGTDTSDEDNFAKFDNTTSRLDTPSTPIGLDSELITRLPTLDEILEKADNEIDPSQYIPEYEYQERLDSQSESKVDTLPTLNPVKRLYNRLFNDGVENAQRVRVHFYDDVDNKRTTDTKLLSKSDSKQLKEEPYANIKATLEDMSATSILDFQASVPRLRQAVKTASRAVGYYDVDFSITRADAGQVNVIIHDLGEPVRIDNRVIDVRYTQGNEHGAYSDVVEKLLPVGSVFNHGEYEQTKASIDAVSGEQGFFDGRWLNSSADVVLPDNTADVSLIYETGKQYAFDNVVFFTIDKETGGLTADPAKLPVHAEILQKLVSFNLGDAYNRTAVRNLSNDLLATGYFNAVNTETVLPVRDSRDNGGVAFEDIKKDRQGDDVGTPSDESVSETVDLGDGVSAIIAPIEFSTSQVLSDKLALVTQKAEQLYNAPDDRLLVIDSTKKSRNLLGRISDAVSSIAKAILPDESSDELSKLEGERPELAGRKSGEQVYADKKVPLYVFVMSDKPRDAQVGIGWGSDSGLRAITKLENHLINRHGMQAGVDVRWSKNEKGVQAYVTRPYTHPLNDKLKASVSYNEEAISQGVGNFGLSSRTVESILSRNTIMASGWHRTYSLRYRLDELDTNAPPHTWVDLPVQFQGGKPMQQALLAGIAFNRTVADNPLSPMRGYRHYYALEAGVKGAVSGTDMAIAKAGISGVYSFGDNAYGSNRAHQLIGGVQLGYIWADKFGDVPYKLRFFAGGDNSIRGYGYQTLSPVSDKGYLVGGQSLAVATAEYNYEILEGLRLATFADVGNAYNKDFVNETKIGAGVGIRYASPVGQVRVDVATGVKEEDLAIKLHFFIGTPF